MSRFPEPHSSSKIGLQKKIAIALVALVLLIGGGALAFWMFPTPTSQNVGYAPRQPIPFSHRLHAGTHKIDCRYCHTGAYKSIHAAIPSLNVCMNCHSVVKVDSPHIQKLRQHFQEGKAIEWVRIHELPDHARFNHKRHVAKGVTCQTCHGNVQEMDVVFQKSPLTMGWCLQCHRGQDTPKKILEDTYPGEKNPKGPVAPFNCGTCHY